MSPLPPVIYEGSVKNIRGNKGEDSLFFEFSDRYSVFDWGAMPDQLKNKGDCLAVMAYMFFDLLSDSKKWKEWAESKANIVELKNSTAFKKLIAEGINSHCLYLSDMNGEKLNNLTPSKNLKVKAVDVLRPSENIVDGKLKYDYTSYKDSPTNALVPLEIIFRFGVPEGSSLLKRAKSPEYRKSIGLLNELKVNDRFENPIIEYSTKLEMTDRYLTKNEAYEISHLNKEEALELESLVSLLALRLKDIFKNIGIELWDGKFELAFSKEKDAKGNRTFILVDSIGPDELRLTYKGIQLSKESIRRYYRETPWFNLAEKAKTMAVERGVKDWKKICREELKSLPPHLDPLVVDKFSMMYKTLTNSISMKYYSQNIFEGTWDLETLIKSMVK